MTRAAAPGRPKQGPALSEGRSLYSTIEGAVMSRAAAPGRPKQGPALSEGRSSNSTIGVLS
jgi:hypothetical protein